MKLKNCRNCNSTNLFVLFTLGNLAFTGRFPKNNSQRIKKGELSLSICKNCKLVQLGNSFNLKYLYGPNYGYRTGINKTMTNHVNNITKYLGKLSKLKNNEAVLDIASNDGTLLNFYNKDIIKFGIDPFINMYSNNYKKINYKISNFFDYNKIKVKFKNKFKIITALSVFYDLEKPNDFLSGIEKLLDINGVALIEIADLYSILKNNMFDTICHEHLEYYSTQVLCDMFKNNNLKLIDIKENNINGASKQYYITKKNSRYRVNIKKIIKVLNNEKKFKMSKIETFFKFKKKIDSIKEKTIEKLNLIKKQKKTIHGYGASTKGNVLLQYFKIGKNYLDYIAERNSKKFNYYTPGTKIKIISELKSRNLKPDYYFVLPWHFKNEIIQREKEIISKGTKFIFPLPSYSEH